MTTRTHRLRPEMTVERFKDFGAAYLPGLVGVEILEVEGAEARIALFRCTQMVLWPK